MRYQRRRRTGENPESGQDSFLDIVSNMVGILIILVMIAGVRIGDAVPPVESSPETPVESPEEPEAPESAAEITPEKAAETEPVPELSFAPVPETIPDPVSEAPVKAPAEYPIRASVPKSANPPALSENLPPKVDSSQMARYIEAATMYLSRRNQISALQAEVNSLNDQALRLKAQASGSDSEYSALMGDVARLEALIERSERSRTEEENKRARQEAELARLTDQARQLAETKAALAQVKKKSTLLQNVPTPLTRKIEGKEAVFTLRGGKVSYVPIGEFSERVRGVFRSMRDIKDGRIDETLGPVDGYRFRFQASLHKVRTEDGTRMTVVFDGGEFLPADPALGETVESALSPQSAFRRKLALFLKDSSTVTLAVYPDSFVELRDVKKYLLENGYSIALRPMPAGKNVMISPNGTESTAY